MYMGDLFHGLLLGGGAVGAAGTFVLVSTLLKREKLSQVFRGRLVPVGEAQPGTLAAIEGRAVPVHGSGPSLVTRTPCAWSEEHYQVNQAREVTSAGDLLVVDATGASAFVDMKNASVLVGVFYRRAWNTYGGRPSDLPAGWTGGAIGADTGPGVSRRCLLRERLLREGETVVVAGVARMEPSGRLVFSVEGGHPVTVARGSRKGIVRGVERRLLLGLVLVLIGACVSFYSATELQLI